MKTNGSGLVIGLALGAALGAAIGYYMACENKDEMFDKLGKSVEKTKKKITKVINDGIEELDMAVDKVNSIAQSAVSRVKATRTGEEEMPI